MQCKKNRITLFLRGDFYEATGEDANVLAKVVGLTITQGRTKNKTGPEIAGFPFHMPDSVTDQMRKSGHGIAIFQD